MTTLRWYAEAPYRALISYVDKLGEGKTSKYKPKLNTVIQDFVAQGLDGPTVAELTKYPEDHRIWHKQLEAILTSGDSETIKAVTQNIEVFHDRLRPPAARRKGSNS